MTPGAIYLDASIVVALLFGRSGARLPATDKSVLASSELLGVEASRALENSRLAGALDDLELARKTKELNKLLRSVHLFPVSDEVLDHARRNFSIRVSALDALHVATAELVLEESKTLEFWTHDSRTAAAATMRGLEVRGVLKG